MKPKYAISPAMSNQSFGECWFGYSRQRGFDTAAKYMFGVAGNLMSKCIKKSLENEKTQTALDSNQMYDPADIGEIHGGQTELSLKDLMNMLTSTRKYVEVKVNLYRCYKGNYILSVSASRWTLVLKE